MIDRRTFLKTGVAAIGLSSCGVSSSVSAGPARSLFGRVERFDSRMSSIIPSTSQMEVLAEGFTWSEGPTWDTVRDCLYFSDVPENKAYRWSQDTGCNVFLDPSGIPAAQAEGFREPGSNGLLFVGGDELLICNHGERTIQTLNLATGERTALFSSFDGSLFNSPNDVDRARDGSLYFTDPPYGLEGLDASPLKEMSANGVYRRSPNGQLTRLLADMTFPNGIALSPDEQHLFVAQSDPSHQYIRRLTMTADGSILNDAMWFDATPLAAPDSPGLPDGMAVSSDGIVFATGPGGVLILSPDGELLGRLNTGQPTGNCCFGEDGRALFITSGDRLLRIETAVFGKQWVA